MLPSNISTAIEKILQSGNGWMRVEKCAKAYARRDASRRVSFYRWRKKVEKGEILGFQVLKLPGNISFIGLEYANPEALRDFSDKGNRFTQALKRGFGFFDYLKWRREKGKQEELKRQRLREADLLTQVRHAASSWEVFEPAKEYFETLVEKREKARMKR